MELRLHHVHPWDLPPAEARALQGRLASRVVRADRFGPLGRVAGVDAGFEDHGRITRAAVSVLSWPELAPLEDAVARRRTSFPYVPGLLSFRELPAVLEALEQLSVPPDLLLCDGQGIAHPRRFGIAAHLGVLTDLPAVGWARPGSWACTRTYRSNAAHGGRCPTEGRSSARCCAPGPG